jgi:hypothetical protein
MDYNPPAPPACEGKDPEMFDHPEFPLPALKVCGTCDVRAWCLRQVDPARHYYDGIVGGHVWQDGKPQGTFSELEDPTLKFYLRGLRPPSPYRINVDKITDFLVGLLPWNRLTIGERMGATAHMAEQGYRIDQAIRATNLDPDLVFDIYQNPTRYKKESTK